MDMNKKSDEDKIKQSKPKIFVESIDTTGSSLSNDNSSATIKNSESKLISFSKCLSGTLNENTENSKILQKPNCQINRVLDPVIRYFDLSGLLNEESKLNCLFKKYKKMICERNDHCETYSIDKLKDLITVENGITNIRTIDTFYLNNIAWFIHLKCNQDASDYNKFYLGIYIYAGDTSPFIVDWSCELVGNVILNGQNIINGTKRNSDLMISRQKTKHCKFKSFVHKFKRNTGFQIPNFIKIEDLTNEEFVKDDCIQITIELSASKPIINFSKDIYYTLNKDYLISSQN